MAKKKQTRKRTPLSKKFIPQASLVSDELYIPNHSGEHTAGTTGTPINDRDIANKKYVDDNATSPAGSDGDIQFNDSGSFGADSNLFWSVARNELNINRIKITTDGTQAYPSLLFNDTNTGFYKSGDSIRTSINNSTIMTVDATGVGIGTSPIEALDVNGGILARGPLAVAGVTGTYMSHEASDITSFFNYGPDASTRGGGYRFYIREADGGNSFVPLTILNDGNVGIGTVSPDFPLTFGATLGQKINLYDGADIGFGVQSSLFEIIGTSLNVDFTFGYGASGSLTRVMTIEGTGNVGIGTTSPTTKLSVNEKSGHTAIGGFCIKLTNKTGAVTVAGQLVQADTSANDAVKLTSIDEEETFGVFLDSGIAANAEAWIVISGIADVAMEDNTTATRGNWVRSSITEAGYADATNATPPSPAAFSHFNEIGNCIETVTATGGGTHILARCVLHFN